jgi:hypothetical protein
MNLTYTVGQDFDTGTLNVVYNDNTSSEVTVTKDMITGFDTSAEGQKTIVISYGGFTAVVKIIVHSSADAKYVTAIAVKAFKNTYALNSEYMGGILEVTYSDDSTETVIIYEDMVKGFSTATTGAKLATVTYKGFETSVGYTVNETVDEVSLNDHISEISDIVATFMEATQENKGSSSPYQTVYDYIYRSAYNNYGAYMTLVSEDLTAAGITDAQLTAFFALQKSFLLPVATEMYNYGIYNGTSIIDALGDYLTVEKLETYAAGIKDYMDIISANDVVNIALAFDLSNFTGQSETGETVYTLQTLIDSAAASGDTAAADFYREIKSDTDNIYVLNKLVDREGFTDLVVSLYNAADLFVQANKADLLKNFNIVNNVLVSLEDSDSLSETVTAYPIADIVPAINYFGNALLTVKSAVNGFNAIMQTIASAADKVSNINVDMSNAVFSSNLACVIDYVGRVAANVSVSELTCIYSDYCDSQVEDTAVSDGYNAKVVVRICKILKNQWDKTDSQSQTAIISFITDYAAAKEVRLANYGQAVADYILDMADYDPETLTAEDVSTVKTRLKTLSDETRRHSYIEGKDIELINDSDLIAIKKGSSKDKIYNEIYYNYEIIYYADNYYTSIECTKIFIVSDVDADTAGFHEFTVEYLGKTIKGSYYVYDDSTAVDYISFGYSSKPNYVAKGASLTGLNKLTMRLSYKFTDAAYWNSFYFEASDENFEDLALTYNTDTVGSFIGYISVTDDILGTVYVPFGYTVYDAGNTVPVGIGSVNTDATVVVNSDITGNITVLYDDGSDKNVDLSSDMISGFDNQKTGFQLITVTYEGFSETYLIKVISGEKKITGLSLFMKKMQYTQNAEITASDITVTAIYDNDGNSCETVTEGYKLEYSTATPGIVSLTVTYEGLTATKDIRVISTEEAAAIKQVYVNGRFVTTEGDDINSYRFKVDELSGVKATFGYSGGTTYGILTYGDGTEADITDDSRITHDEINNSVGDHEMYFYYDGIKSYNNISYTVYVSEYVEEIDLQHLDIYYVVGSAKLTGAIDFVTNLSYSGYGIDYIPTEYGVTSDGYDLNTVGTYTVTFTCANCSASRKIRVVSVAKDSEIYRISQRINVGLPTFEKGSAYETKLFRFDIMTADGYGYKTYQRFEISADYIVEGTFDTSKAGVTTFEIDIAKFFSENASYGYTAAAGTTVTIYMNVTE